MMATTGTTIRRCSAPGVKRRPSHWRWKLCGKPCVSCRGLFTAPRGWSTPPTRHGGGRCCRSSAGAWTSPYKTNGADERRARRSWSSGLPTESTLTCSASSSTWLKCRIGEPESSISPEEAWRQCGSRRSAAPPAATSRRLLEASRSNHERPSPRGDASRLGELLAFPSRADLARTTPATGGSTSVRDATGAKPEERPSCRYGTFARARARTIPGTTSSGDMPVQARRISSRSGSFAHLTARASPGRASGPAGRLAIAGSVAARLTCSRGLDRPRMVRRTVATDAHRPLIGFGIKHRPDIASTSCRRSAASRRCWIYKQ